MDARLTSESNDSLANIAGLWENCVAQSSNMRRPGESFGGTAKQTAPAASLEITVRRALL